MLSAGAWPGLPSAAGCSLHGCPTPLSPPHPQHAGPAFSVPCPQLVGMRYLHEVLKPVISRVFEEKKYMELDPCKMDLGRAR